MSMYPRMTYYTCSFACEDTWSKHLLCTHKYLHSLYLKINKHADACRETFYTDTRTVAHTYAGKHKKPLNPWQRLNMSFTRDDKRAVINKKDDLLISSVVIHCIICVLKHITYHGVVSVKVLLIKFLSAYRHFKAAADLWAVSPQCLTNGTDVNMFICESSLQFSAAHIVDEDYPGIMRLEKTLFDVYLWTAYRCSNMELGPIMGGKYKREKSVTPTSPIWLPVRMSFSDIHFQKLKFNRRLWCKSQTITLCGVEGRIKPSNHSCRCLGASNIMPYLLDRSHIFQCVIAANNSQCLRFVGP